MKLPFVLVKYAIVADICACFTMPFLHIMPIGIRTVTKTYGKLGTLHSLINVALQPSLSTSVLLQYAVKNEFNRGNLLIKLHPLFWHCPNSDRTPPSLKRALRGTLFPGRSEEMPFELQFSLHRRPKPPWQGFRPPQKQANTRWTWTSLL